MHGLVQTRCISTGILDRSTPSQSNPHPSHFSPAMSLLPMVASPDTKHNVDGVRYLFAVIADRASHVTATQDEMAAINEFNDRIIAAGQQVMAAGVASPDEAVVFDNRHGAGLVSCGPVVDSPEFMAGFWIIDAEDVDTAHSLAADASRACNRRVEIRPFL